MEGGEIRNYQCVSNKGGLKKVKCKSNEQNLVGESLMKSKMVFISIVAGLLLLPFFTMHADAKPFYEGKTIRLIVTTRPGGGYDFYGRLIGRFMQKHLPGSTFVIKNVPSRDM